MSVRDALALAYHFHWSWDDVMALPLSVADEAVRFVADLAERQHR